jgi:DNA-binding NarL/FixJ family response regulator
MDINLPGMSGIECVRRLEPQMLDTQFMMLTVYDDSDHIFKALSSGATGYMLKCTPCSELRAGKIKGLWTFGEAAVIAKRDALVGPLAQRLEAWLNNKFKANTVLATKLARAVYFMLKTKTVFDPARLVAAWAKTDLALASVNRTS